MAVHLPMPGVRLDGRNPPGKGIDGVSGNLPAWRGSQAIRITFLLHSAVNS